MTSREQRVALLNNRVAQLGDDEVLILATIAKRLQYGATQYGVLNLLADKRDWRREAGEEMADALVYLAANELTKERV